MKNWKKGCDFGHIDKFWKGYDGQTKKNACKNAYLGSIFTPEKYVFRVCFESPFTRMISSLKYKCPPPGHYHISYVILHDSLHDNPTQQFLHCIRGHRYTRRLILRPISAARPRTDTCTKNGTIRNVVYAFIWFSFATVYGRLLHPPLPTMAIATLAIAIVSLGGTISLCRIDYFASHIIFILLVISNNFLKFVKCLIYYI